MPRWTKEHWARLDANKRSIEMTRASKRLREIYQGFRDQAKSDVHKLCECWTAFGEASERIAELERENARLREELLRMYRQERFRIGSDRQQVSIAQVDLERRIKELEASCQG